jgi:hypothetical protein
VPAVRAQSIQSFGGGLLSPVGNFRNQAASSGWGLAYRTEFQLAVHSLRVRTDLAFDHIGGVAPVKNYEYQSIGANLVHYNGEVFYQYAGVSIMTAKTTLNTTGTGVARNPTRNEFAFGTQAGVGVIMLIWRVQPFLEAGIATANARSVKATWVPLRLGVRL